MFSSLDSCGWITTLWVSPTMESRWLEDANYESGKTWNEEVGLNPDIWMEAVRKTTRNSIRIDFVTADVSAEHGLNTRIQRNFWSNLIFILVSYARRAQCKILPSKEHQNSWQRRYYIRPPLLKVTVQETTFGRADFVPCVSVDKISTANQGTSNTKAFCCYETWLERCLTEDGFRTEILISCTGTFILYLHHGKKFWQFLICFLLCSRCLCTGTVFIFGVSYRK